jgi:hypothetical protein
MAKWTKVGSLRKSKAGGLYIKVDADVSLKKDSALSLQDPRKKIADSLAAGRLTEEKAAEFTEKVPDYIRYEIFQVED